LSLEKIEMLRDLCLLDGCFSYKMGKIAEPSIKLLYYRLGSFVNLPPPLCQFRN